MCSHVTLQVSQGKVFEGAQCVTKEGTNLIIQKHLRNFNYAAIYHYQLHGLWV